MKNTFYIFLAGVLMVTLAGCKSDEEKAVDAAVEASQEMMESMDADDLEAMQKAQEAAVEAVGDMDPDDVKAMQEASMEMMEKMGN